MTVLTKIVLRRNMKNKKMFSNIVHYIKDEIDSELKAKFEIELQNDPELAEEYNNVKNTLDFVAQYPEEEPPQDFLFKLNEKVKSIEQKKSEKRKITKKAKFRANISFYIKFTAAVIILFVLIISLVDNFVIEDKRVQPVIIGKASMLKGVVLLENEDGAYPRRIVSDEEIKDKQIIRTGRNSMVNLEFPGCDGEFDSLSLQENTEIRVHAPSLINLKDTGYMVQYIDLIQGSVYVDIKSRNADLLDSKSESASMKSNAPFFVKTPNCDARVRGTKFTIEYDDKMKTSVVFVSKGRVDVFSKVESKNFAKVEEGYFCIVGQTENLKKLYPELINLEDTDESIVTRPVLSVEAQVIENRTIKILLSNNYDKLLKLSYFENRDNIGIRYEFPSDDSVSLNWSPVRRLIADIEPGNFLSFEYAIPEILRSEISGDYYLQVVYSGYLEIPGLQPFAVANDKIEYWRKLKCQHYSNRVAVVINEK